jgi:hypothetical protein
MKLTSLFALVSPTKRIICECTETSVCDRREPRGNALGDSPDLEERIQKELVEYYRQRGETRIARVILGSQLDTAYWTDDWGTEHVTCTLTVPRSDYRELASRSEEVERAVEEILGGTGHSIDHLRVAQPLPEAEAGWRARLLRDISRSEDLQVTPELWEGLLQRLTDLIREGYFEREFPGSAGEGLNNQPLRSAIREAMGSERPSKNELPSADQVRQLVESLFAHAVKPSVTDGGRSYDERKGRYEYTVHLNAVFKSCNAAYELKRGRLQRISPDVMEVRVLSTELHTDDQHLRKLLTSATDAFFDRSGKRRLEGLRSMVDAYERVKTMADSDKKGSIRVIVGKLTPDPQVQQYFDGLLASLTKIANTYTIRHHEKSRVVLDDQDIIEYLFYSYYNIVALVLWKIGQH